jgi:hypothetical protein
LVLNKPSVRTGKTISTTTFQPMQTVSTCLPQTCYASSTTARALGFSW